MTFYEITRGTHTFLEKYQKVIVHASALFFLFAGFIYSFYLGTDLRFPDEEQYYILAKNLVEGNGYTLDGENPTAFRTPGYPLFLGFFIWLGASPAFLRYLNFIALAWCLYIIRTILRHENAESGAALSSLLLVIYGVLFYTAGTLYPQTIFTLVLLLVFRVAMGQQLSYPRAVIFGLLSAFLIMLHPTAIFIPPLIVLWMFGQNKWQIIRRAMISAFIVVACFSPWAYRNYKNLDAFVPVSTHGGEVLYAGNNQGIDDIDAYFNYLATDVSLKAYSLNNEVERDRFFLKEAVGFLKDQPARAVKLYILKFLNYFNFQNKLRINSESNWLQKVIMFITYYPLLICLVARLFFISKIRLSRVEVLFVFLYFVSALFHAIFIPRIRFRLPYDVLLIAHIGIMFSLMLDWIKAREERPQISSL